MGKLNDGQMIAKDAMYHKKCFLYIYWKTTQMLTKILQEW